MTDFHLLQLLADDSACERAITNEERSRFRPRPRWRWLWSSASTDDRDGSSAGQRGPVPWSFGAPHH